MNTVLERIKEKYPKNKSAAEDPSQDYCVGGAAILYYCEYSPNYLTLASTHAQRFPDETFLTGIVFKFNEKLSYDKAFKFASNVIFFNDSGQFERAWETLGQALVWKEEGLCQD